MAHHIVSTLKSFRLNKNLTAAVFIFLLFAMPSFGQSKEDTFLYDFVPSEQKVQSCIIEFYSKDKRAEGDELLYETNKHEFFDRNGVKSLYGKDGKRMKEIKTNRKNQILWITDYKYNTNGKIQSIVEVNNKQKLRWKSTFKYDEKGNRIEYKELMKDSSVYIYTTYRYDTANNLRLEKEEQIFDSVRKKTKIVYTYDTAKLNIQKAYYNLDKLVQTVKSKFDRKGILLTDTFYNSLNQAYKFVNYEFENGKLIAETVMSMEGEEKEKESVRIEYDTDDNENWIEKKVFKGDVLITKTTRKITYYEDKNTEDN